LIIEPFGDEENKNFENMGKSSLRNRNNFLTPKSCKMKEFEFNSSVKGKEFMSGKKKMVASASQNVVVVEKFDSLGEEEQVKSAKKLEKKKSKDLKIDIGLIDEEDEEKSGEIDEVRVKARYYLVDGESSLKKKKKKVELKLTKEARNWQILGLKSDKFLEKQEEKMRERSESLKALLGRMETVDRDRASRSSRKPSPRLRSFVRNSRCSEKDCNSVASLRSSNPLVQVVLKKNRETKELINKLIKKGLNNPSKPGYRYPLPFGRKKKSDYFHEKLKKEIRFDQNSYSIEAMNKLIEKDTMRMRREFEEQTKPRR
jgi:hypothetical protein